LSLHAELCQALSDPKRILILYALQTVKRSVSDLSLPLGIRQADLSQQLSILRNRAWSRPMPGEQYFYSLNDPKVIDAHDLLRES